MRQITVFSALQKITSAFLNLWQANAMAMRAANAGGNHFPSSAPQGVDAIMWENISGVPNNTLIEVDSNDWHDRIVWGSAFAFSSAASLVGETTDYNYDATLSSTVYSTFEGYVGRGGWSNTAGSGTPVSNGSVVTRGTTSGGVTSWYVNLKSPDGLLMLYTDPTTGALYLYNATGATIYPSLRLHFTGATGLRF